MIDLNNFVQNTCRRWLFFFIKFNENENRKQMGGSKHWDKLTHFCKVMENATHGAIRPHTEPQESPADTTTAWWAGPQPAGTSQVRTWRQTASSTVTHSLKVIGLTSTRSYIRAHRLNKTQQMVLTLCLDERFCNLSFGCLNSFVFICPGSQKPDR